MFSQKQQVPVLSAKAEWVKLDSGNCGVGQVQINQICQQEMDRVHAVMAQENFFTGSSCAKQKQTGSSFDMDGEVLAKL